MTDQETIDRLVIALATASGSTEARVRNDYGITTPTLTRATYREDGGSWDGNGS